MTKKRPLHCEHCDKIHGEVEPFTKLVYASTPDGTTYLTSKVVVNDLIKTLVKHGIVYSAEKVTVTPITQEEKIISGTCISCIEYFEKLEKQVKEGGLYYECKECKKIGVLPKSSYTLEIRKDLNKESDTDGTYPEVYVIYPDCSKHTLSLETTPQSNKTLH